jgi:hypothetical protein
VGIGYCEISVAKTHPFLKEQSDVLLDTSKCVLIRNFAYSRTIDISADIRVLGPSCFASCLSVAVVNFAPESVCREICDHGFASSALQSISIPHSIEIIREYCFSHCKGLKSVSFEGDSEIKEIGARAFAFSSLPSITLPRSIEIIGTFCFEQCTQLSALSFAPDIRLRRISAGSFTGTSLSYFTIPRMISFIDGSAFLDTKLVGISIESGHSFIQIDGPFVIDAIDKTLIHGFGPSLSRISVPASIEVLGPYCFSSCKQLAVILFPSDSVLRRIESCAFFQTAISSAVLPSSVTFIATDAFSSATNLSLSTPSPEFDEWKLNRTSIPFHRPRSLGSRQPAEFVLDQTLLNTIRGPRPTSTSLTFVDLPNNVHAAVKTYPTLHQPEETQWLTEFEKRFAFRHPCVSPLIGFVPPLDGDGFKVLTVARSNSLKDLLVTPTSWWTSTAKAIVIVGIILGGIAMHEIGLIHCNLKPTNILLDDKHRVQLTDFGVPGTPGFSKSPPYSAPEIGKDDKPNDKCDIFSFGWILYHICTPSTPTAIRMHVQAVRQSMTQKFLGRDAMEISKDLPSFVAQMIRSAWSPDPLERPSFADLFATLSANHFKVLPDVDTDEVTDFVKWVEAERHSF